MSDSNSTPVTHIVLFKYRPDLSWKDFESHFDSFKALQSRCIHHDTGKPYMLSMRMGKNLSWEAFGKGMTHGFVLEFASQNDLDYYLTQDPVHLDFSKKAGPLIEDSVVVDIRDGILFGPSFQQPITAPDGRKYRGKCHCGSMNWDVEFSEEPQHVLCHCDTCKQLGGGPYSCNYIVPKEALHITKGSPGHYAYKGASGKISYPFNIVSHQIGIQAKKYIATFAQHVPLTSITTKTQCRIK